MACVICQTRREKRACPGVNGDICAICCGEQREQSIDCPFECEYLQHAHTYEELEKDADGLPNRDHKVPPDFVNDNVRTIMIIEQAIVKAALKNRAIDNDVREALDGLARTYQTLSTGLYYESRPANPIAASIFDAIQRRVEELRELERERGIHKTTDSQVLNVLVFLQQLEYSFNNGRKRGRSFLHSIYNSLAELAQGRQPQPPSLIVS